MAFSGGRSTISVATLDGGSVRQLTTEGREQLSGSGTGAWSPDGREIVADDFAFVWSPDGRTIVYVSQEGDGKLVTVSVAELLGGN